MEKVISLDKSRIWDEISIVLTDDSGISIIHQQHLSNSNATDVISFLYEPVPGENNQYTGEVIVNVQRAVQERNHGKDWTADKELALYIAHGCDHLAGYDDHVDSDRKSMRNRELRWLKEIPSDILNLEIRPEKTNV